MQQLNCAWQSRNQVTRGDVGTHMAFRCAFRPIAFLPTVLALAALGGLVLYLRS